MKARPTIFSLVLLSVLNTTLISAQEIWDGPIVLFSKPAFANWTLPENQDRMTENVWITRSDSRGLFNFRLEESYANDLSPQDTEWSFGTTADIKSLTFTDWETAIDENPPGMIDQPMVVHLISEDIYIDLVFRSWGQGAGAGGSFSYERSTDPNLGLSPLDGHDEFSLYPNPASDRVYISGLDPGEAVEVYSVLGIKMLTATAEDRNLTVDLAGLRSGLYLVRSGYGKIRRLVIN